MSGKSTSLYKQIQADLLEKISLGYYTKDTLIPTELELSKQYNVSRVTIRKAMENLISQGLLEPIVGVGTFVRGASLAKNIITLKGFSAEMRTQGVIPSTIVDVFMIKKAPSYISKILCLDEDESVYYFERRRYGDGKLFILEKTHMSTNLYPDISLQVLENSKYDFFEKEKGLKITHSNHLVLPLLSSKKVSELFQIAENSPIVHIDNTTFLGNGQILDFTELTLNSPNYQLSYTKKR